MIHICLDKKRSMSIHLHSSFKKHVQRWKQLKIFYGLKEVSVTPLFSDAVPEDKCYVTQDVIRILDIPISSPYEIKFGKNKMIIGPYIGILAAVTKEILQKSIPYLSVYVKDYEKVGGTIIVFSLDGIDREKETITGLMYDPKRNNWTEGLFSYPSSVFSVVETSLTENWSTYINTMEHFHQKLGKRMFNYPNFDKWQMYQLLKGKLQQYLPKTMIYYEPEDVWKMLKEYPSLYVKPINGRLGKYVLKITRISNGVIVKDGRQSKKVKHIKSWSLFKFYLRRILKEESYLIQQAIDLVKFDDQIIDFRIIMVKNSQGKWDNIGAFSRYGGKNSIVSNITAGGKAEIGRTTLKTVFELSIKEMIDLINLITNLMTDAITILEENGYHLGNLGFDIGIDQSGKVWIIEINNQNPDHYIAVKANKPNILYQAKLSNILYAKTLSMSFE
ncbi:YheC/YheD family protein [Metabacillus halosaccharovorans]|uniref:YheC/YheD family endospore coat-associated protein n=1 Tax=Metabacillus halosaccharovorans TaxID=930124 RepID=UPI001C1FEDDA|nr:YheC/YheD family protein [Metabacillus halosaccharovorans]MBU7592263.1 YheC/YheD family protein [Metabacillus halosaccharovorans]